MDRSTQTRLEKSLDTLHAVDLPVRTLWALASAIAFSISLTATGDMTASLLAASLGGLVILIPLAFGWVAAVLGLIVLLTIAEWLAASLDSPARSSSRH